MMLGGPDVGARQTCRPPTVTFRSGSSVWNVNSLGVVASAFATRPRSIRTTCVSSSTVAPACAYRFRARAESTFMPWFSSTVSAATWIAATWSSEIDARVARTGSSDADRHANVRAPARAGGAGRWAASAGPPGGGRFDFAHVSRPLRESSPALRQWRARIVPRRCRIARSARTGTAPSRYRSALPDRSRGSSRNRRRALLEGADESAGREVVAEQRQVDQRNARSRSARTGPSGSRCRTRARVRPRARSSPGAARTATRNVVAAGPRRACARVRCRG